MEERNDEMPVNKGFGLLFEMGCGKTLTAIAVMGTGYKLGKLKRVLIVAPTSVCAVWPKEFQDYAAFPFTVKVLLGTKAQRLKDLSDLQRFPYPHLKVAVINYESTWREGIFEALDDFDPDMIICDESQRIKTHDAEQSKAMHQLGDKARYKMILSELLRLPGPVCGDGRLQPEADRPVSGPGSADQKGTQHCLPGDKGRSPGSAGANL